MSDTNAPTVEHERLVRTWRSMKTAPKTGMEIEVLVYHANRRYAKKAEKAQWESIKLAKWIEHNGGGGRYESSRE